MKIIPGRWWQLPVCALAWLGLTAPLPAALVVVDLSHDANYQNQQAHQHLGGASASLELPPITLGGAQWTMQFNLSQSLGSGGNRTLRVQFLTGTANTTIGYADNGVDADLPLALAYGQSVSSGLTFTDPTSEPAGYLSFYFSGDSTSRGNWIDGNSHFLPFSLNDGPLNYYGFVQAIVSNYDSSSSLPSLSLAGFAYESIPGTAATVTSVPEPGMTALFLGVVVLATAEIWRRRKLQSPRCLPLR